MLIWSNRIANLLNFIKANKTRKLFPEISNGEWKILNERQDEECQKQCNSS
jgi:uncharacterized membrane protein YheB (UPF0754 family)